MNMSGILNIFTSFFEGFKSPGFFENLVSAVIISVCIIVVFNLIRFCVGKAMNGHFTQKTILTVKRLIHYVGFIIVLFFVFKRLGINVNALLGAAGIAGVAIGFAAQTSFSNIISGFFLLLEKHFLVGDAIEVDGSSGVVQSVDLLSIKLQTYDNRYIRIPNETLIKTNVINVSRFPIRRMDIFITLPYKEDIEHVKKVFDDIVRHNIYVLDNPQPLFIIDKFDGCGVNLMFGLWFKKEDFTDLKNSFFMTLKTRFEAESIDLPYNKLDIVTSGEKENVALPPKAEGEH